MLDKQSTNWVMSIAHSPYLNLETSVIQTPPPDKESFSHFAVQSWLIYAGPRSLKLHACGMLVNTISRRSSKGTDPKMWRKSSLGRLFFPFWIPSLSFLSWLLISWVRFFVRWGSVSLSSSGWRWTCGSPPATASWVLGLLTYVHSCSSMLGRLQNGVQVILSSINPASNLKSEFFPGYLRVDWHSWFLGSASEMQLPLTEVTTKGKKNQQPTMFWGCKYSISYTFM